ncbi:MAG: hypothetical protein A2527_12010 [Candidatus Lambdaproteobacteria bacterium RIFOXYD2_FULL_50_16]|uniref:ABC transporter ATP-binding protein n=1 Tax=Candidatus Lambdaproteobacteria bacterium RIFOXYD2_FULL_50_16 TaxID=1817772 RepID=A0A1F6GD73_9PROT|nr:MAG: hypothetical protein A2527_12010 [Candidatus Lambdaproteobacteria bacterium RIFOXYD2_FULL_50_16]
MIFEGLLSPQARDYLKRLGRFLPEVEKKKVKWLLLGMILTAGLETTNVGLILPFISYVADPSSIDRFGGLKLVIAKLGLNGEAQVLALMAGVLLVFVIIKNLTVFVFLRFSLNFQFVNAANFSTRLLEKYLFANFLFHLDTHSSDLVANLKDRTPLVFSRSIGQMMLLISEILITAGICGFLLIMRPWATLAGLVVIGGLGTLIYRPLRVRARLYGKLRIEAEQQLYRWFYQGLHGIKEAKIYDAEEYFVSRTRKNYHRLSDIQIFEMLMGQAPRLFLEGLTVGGLMLIIMVLVLQGGGSSEIFPTLALFGAAAFRLVPATNRILAAMLSLKMASQALVTVTDSLDQALAAGQVKTNRIADQSARYEGTIEIEALCFTYPQAENPALNQVNLSIGRFESVGIIGPSGSGKSTLLNLLLGLLTPSAGRIKVGGKDIQENLGRWQSEIGFVPQNIYLIDDSIRANVAYGIEDGIIEDQRIWEALQMAQLDQFVKDLPHGLDTPVGEMGDKLSGGQRQRIGIARALYHNPEVLVFDEATSALDQDTEREITKSIEALAHKKTIIIVAHRLSTIENCDRVFRFERGLMVEEQVNKIHK